MPDIDVLRELTGQFQRPGFDDLVAVSRRRRRRSALAAATAAAAAVVLAVGIAAASLSQGQRAQEPVEQPSPSQTETSATGGGWTPERIRAEGSPADLPEFRRGPSLSGLDAQLYCVASSCSFLDSEANRRWALEVTQGDRSALFDVRGIPWGKDFDEDSILVQDGTDQAVRFRLLQADGSAVQLRMVDEPVSAVRGPHVMLIEDLAVYRRGYGGPGARLYLVDDRAATIRPLDVPEDTEWGPNIDQFLWGVKGCRVVWQRPDGRFDHHDLDCRTPELTDIPSDYWNHLSDWAQPGRMVVLEHNAAGVPLVLHASLDYGATWQRIKLEHRYLNGNSNGEQVGVALASALEQVR